MTAVQEQIGKVFAKKSGSMSERKEVLLNIQTSKLNLPIITDASILQDS